MRRILMAAAVALALPVPALAENLAIVVANARYDGFPALRTAPAVDEAVRAFAEAGFEVIELRDARFDVAARALSEARERVAEADRVAILLSGHFVQSGGASWLLARDARSPDAFTAGAEGLPLAAFLELAATRAGASAVLVADEDARLTPGAGLRPGAAFPEPPQGVALFGGSARGILTVLRGGLLVPGQSLAATAAGLPATVRAAGFLPPTAFLPADGADAAPPAPPAAAPDDPARIEAGLGLDRAARREIQRDLALLGHDPRGIDGIFGRGTRDAIARWQRAQGLPDTGYLTGNQVVRLRDQGLARRAEADRQDTAFWRETGEGATEAGLRRYLERYPEGLHADRARALLAPFDASRREAVAQADREAWERALAEGTPEAYADYLARFPEGAFRAEAQVRREAASGDAVQAADRAEEDRIVGNAITRLLVEQRLRQLGTDPGPIDGIFDEATRRAIRSFQRARDLPETGHLSEATLARLLVP